MSESLVLTEVCDSTYNLKLLVVSCGCLLCRVQILLAATFHKLYMCVSIVKVLNEGRYNGLQIFNDQPGIYL